MLEKTVEQYLVHRCEEQGWMCLKYPADFYEGIPDRIILMPGGRCVWAELKRPKGGVLSPMQRVMHEKLRRAGQEVHVVKNREEADALIDALK